MHACICANLNVPANQNFDFGLWHLVHAHLLMNHMDGHAHVHVHMHVHAHVRVRVRVRVQVLRECE